MEDDLTNDPGAANGAGEPAFDLPPECIPNIDELVIEDGKPVDSIRAEKQHRALTEPLYASWPGPGEGRRRLVLANVGLFFQMKQPPLVPDVMLALDVDPARDLSVRQNRSYIVWVIGKVPDVVIELVSDRTGGDLGHKRRDYARIGVPYYVVFDPDNFLEQGELQVFRLSGGRYEPIPPSWLETVGVGLTIWEGEYEGQPGRWLRWCDQQGRIIPTGRERAEQERQRADQAQQRADRAQQQVERLAARLRALGVDPDA
jgi:hypothetical protein